MTEPSPRRGRNARWLLAAVLGVLFGGVAVTALTAQHRRILERIAVGT